MLLADSQLWWCNKNRYTGAQAIEIHRRRAWHYPGRATLLRSSGPPIIASKCTDTLSIKHALVCCLTEQRCQYNATGHLRNKNYRLNEVQKLDPSISLDFSNLLWCDLEMDFLRSVLIADLQHNWHLPAFSPDDDDDDDVDCH